MLFFMLPSEHQGNTYAISIAIFLKHRHFQKETHAALFLETVLRYREQGKFQLHGFAIMPDHIHLLITTTVDQALPKCVQLIKGGNTPLRPERSRRKRYGNTGITTIKFAALWTMAISSDTSRTIRQPVDFRRIISMSILTRRMNHFLILVRFAWMRADVWAKAQLFY
jgi:REP element-mobilizing transposase RayT